MQRAGSTPFSVTLSTFVSPTNALFGGTLLNTFSNSSPGASSSNQLAGPVGFGTGLYSVTEKYVLHGNKGSKGLSTSPSIILSALAVPEPAAWGLMLLGFGAAGGMLRHKRRTALAVR